jgi:hypothetical protein
VQAAASAKFAALTGLATDRERGVPMHLSPTRAAIGTAECSTCFVKRCADSLSLSAAACAYLCRCSQISGGCRLFGPCCRASAS